jgi:hypothetical protein
MVLWYIFYCFGTLSQDKSGNPVWVIDENHFRTFQEAIKTRVYVIKKMKHNYITIQRQKLAIHI